MHLLILNGAKRVGPNLIKLVALKEKEAIFLLLHTSKKNHVEAGEISPFVSQEESLHQNPSIAGTLILDFILQICEKIKFLLFKLHSSGFLRQT
jgi:hypothetical protein